MNSEDVLRSVMQQTHTSQSTLAKVSGVRQPTISQILSGRVGVSDDQLRRLLFCMGFDLQVVRQPLSPTLTRSEWRSWRLHRQISSRLTAESLDEWTPQIQTNLNRLDSGVRGEPHVSNLHEWRRLVGNGDVLGVHRLLTGLDRHSMDMREVSPLSGILSQAERMQVLAN